MGYRILYFSGIGILNSGLKLEPNAGIVRNRNSGFLESSIPRTKQTLEHISSIPNGTSFGTAAQKHSGTYFGLCNKLRFSFSICALAINPPHSVYNALGTYRNLYKKGHSVFWISKLTRQLRFASNTNSCFSLVSIERIGYENRHPTQSCFFIPKSSIPTIYYHQK
jgi:hypothetical protein